MTGDRSLVRSPYEDALGTVEVTLAANASARTGRPVGIGGRMRDGADSSI
ncbi:hypothetical protein [Cohnella nanjingensis]|nr:hypothetical protein [Cohnella nanjingensis]